MPNPFLSQPKKGRHHEKRQDRGFQSHHAQESHHAHAHAQENPFLSAKRNDPEAPKRNCFSALTPPSESGIALVSAAAPVQLTFEESFPSLSKKPAPTVSVPPALNFKLAIQANAQPRPYSHQEQQQQQQQPQPQPQPQPQHQSLQQLRRNLNPFLSNNSGLSNSGLSNSGLSNSGLSNSGLSNSGLSNPTIRSKNSNGHNHVDDCDEDRYTTHDAYDSAYINYYKD
jgi:hypothetical protein